jgi:hypothetical protein
MPKHSANLMRYLLFTAILNAPVVALAQQPLNLHGFILTHRAALYRYPADTLALPGHRTVALKPGEDVVVVQQQHYWLTVKRGNGRGTGFSTDTATYYLPVEALKDAKRFLLL